MTPGRAQYFRDASSKRDVVIDDSIARVIAGWHASRPDLEVDSIAITARLARLQSLLAPKLEAVFGRFGLRGADFAVLATLVRLADARVSQRRLASELGLTAGTMSLRIDRLVKHGLASRDPDPEDGRGALITLTARGRELFEACAPEHLANSEELLAGLTEPERGELGELLGKLLYTLEDDDPDDRLGPELGLVVDGAPVALERRRAVGLPPLPGLLVRHVDPAGAAAASGLRPGDLLRSAGRRPLRSRHDLEAALLKSGKSRRGLTLEVTRGVEPIRLRLVTASTAGDERGAGLR
ncbi:MAG TPA: MarR family transcriptional regulator [Solirubrobacteraceae bacterium]|nr:MarR family transcriptional regulator [Solirubrobacteraceae bacterium]